MIQLTRANLTAAGRHDFPQFVIQCFYELNPGAELLWGSHNELICAAMEECRKGRTLRQIINVPPRHLKSLIVSIALPAWLLGHDPTAQVMCVSYGQELSDKLARDCQTIMNSDFYRRMFRTRLSPKRSSVHDFETTEGGCRFATSIGGTMTGRGADVIILDDPLKPDEALSDLQRRAVNHWFSHSLYSRLNSKAAGVIIVVMQRLHEDDLTGHVQQQEPWQVLSLPAIAEKDEEYAFSTLLGPGKWVRHKGDLLHPEREGRATLDAIKGNLGEIHFSAQYQQSPVPLDGGIIKHNWIRRYAENDRPQKFDRIVQSWDTANKASELSAYSVGTTWGIKDQKFYLLHVYRKQVDFPTLKRAVVEQARAFNVDEILIEDKASGTALIAELRDQGLCVHAIEPEGDKIMRLVTQSPAFENGFVFVPVEAHWVAAYIQEITGFPRGKYNDQVDSTSQFLSWIRHRGPGWGIFEYYRRGAEEVRNRITGKVKILVTNNSSCVVTMSGISIMVPPNRIIEVSDEDAKPLLMQGYLLVKD